MSLSRRAALGGVAATALAVPAYAQLAAGGALVRPPAQLPTWRRFAAAQPKPNGRPAITIVIDDMGVTHTLCNRIVALPGPLTLSWFPFAHRLPQQVAEASARGHETTLHMPMQATGNTTSWTGPDPLRIDLKPEENLRRLQAALDAVPDIVGLNNHMGSVATRDADLMALVAAELRRREMLLLDSVTIPQTQAYRQAAIAGVPAAARDFFIDHVADAGVIRGQLAQIEFAAHKYGHDIAIGHPRPLTVEALETWVPGLLARGFALWPLSATVALRNNIDLSA